MSSTSSASSNPSLLSTSPTPSSSPFFTSASQSTSSASSTGSPTSSSAAPSSSSLYLYTFLATLVLLLGISAAIVIRSFVLRRRHQGVIEEAIRAGTWAPPTFGGRGRRDIGEKPRMWDAWVGKDRELPGTQGYLERDITDIQKGGAASDEIDPGSSWDGILPISATYLNPPPPSTTTSANIGRAHTGHRAILPWRQRAYSSSPAASPSIPNSSMLSLPAAARVATSSFSPPPPPLPIPLPTGLSSQSSTPVLSPPTSDPDLAAVSPPNPMLRLTLLIAMPSPPSMRHARDDEEEGPPVVEFGLIDVDVRNRSSGMGGVSRASNEHVPESASGDRGIEAGI